LLPWRIVLEPSNAALPTKPTANAAYEVVPASARSSKIVVVSIPAGAHVVIDGTPRCTTPCTLRLHPMEPVVLEVKRPGYSPWRRELRVEMLATNLIDAVLAPSVD
jgi:hypothetical protein